MPPPLLSDPHWAAGDLLEHARRLVGATGDAAPAGAAATGVRPATDGAERDADLVARVRELHACCVRLEIDPVVASVPARRRARLDEALDRLACAADDLAGIVLLRSAGEPFAADDATPDLGALLTRVAERHDHVVRLLQSAGIRRSAPGA